MHFLPGAPLPDLAQWRRKPRLLQLSVFRHFWANNQQFPHAWSLDEGLIDETETSQITGIPAATLRTWRVRCGGLHYYKTALLQDPSSVRYDVDEVVAWVRKAHAFDLGLRLHRIDLIDTSDERLPAWLDKLPPRQESIMGMALNACAKILGPDRGRRAATLMNECNIKKHRLQSRLTQLRRGIHPTLRMVDGDPFKDVEGISCKHLHFSRGFTCSSAAVTHGPCFNHLPALANLSRTNS